MGAMPRKQNWRLWFAWIAGGLVATVGTLVVYYIFSIVLLVLVPMAATNPPLWLSWIWYPLPGLIFGGVTGAVQAWILRRHMQAAGRWFWASLVGWGLGWLGHDFLWYGWRQWMGVPPRFDPTSPAYATAVLACVVAGRLLAGTVAGVGQWLVLRRQSPQAEWWVPVSTVGAILNGFCIAEC